MVNPLHPYTYPNCRTLRERKHQATVDFFTGELRNMQWKDAVPVTSTRSSGSDHIDSGPERSISCSQAILVKDRPGSAPGANSLSAVRLPEVNAVKPVNPITTTDQTKFQNPPAAKPHQIVWNAHNGKSMLPKTKRKMTLEERSAYKETRKRGACEKCRRQKGRVVASTACLISSVKLTTLVHTFDRRGPAVSSHQSDKQSYKKVLFTSYKLLQRLH